MIELTPQSIIDYQVCSLFYDFKYVEELQTSASLDSMLSKKYEKTIKKIISFYLHKKQSGNTPSIDILYNKWQKQWFGPNSDYYSILMDKSSSFHKSMRLYGTKGVSVILEMYNFFQNLPIMPVAIQEEYVVPITEKAKLTDKYDLIFYDGNSFGIVNFVFSYASKALLNDTKMICDLYAYKYKLSEQASKKSVSVFYYDLNSQKNGLEEKTINSKDFSYLHYWCKEIESAKIHPPRRGLTSYCKSCPYDKQCAQWNQWPLSKEELKNV